MASNGWVVHIIKATEGFVSNNFTIKPNNSICSDTISLANIKPEFPITQSQKEQIQPDTHCYSLQSLSQQGFFLHYDPDTERKKEREG